MKQYMIFAAITMLGVQAPSREVAIEDFYQPKRIDGNVADPSSIELLLEPDPEVANAMLVYYSGDDQPAPAFPAGGTVPGRLEPEFPPARGNPGIINAKPHKLRDQQFADCDLITYSPISWISREVATRRSRYYTTMASIACESGLPTNLLDAVIAQESGYRSSAISKAGAMGMMQIMPGTARTLGLSTPFEPIANMRAGARYLRQQIDRFGRIDLALAAYNAGPERRSLRAGYIPAIPETQHYVRTILTNWGRLIELNAGRTQAPDRGELAMTAVRASGYREVELIRYDGLNASNPM